MPLHNQMRKFLRSPDKVSNPSQYWMRAKEDAKLMIDDLALLAEKLRPDLVESTFASERLAPMLQAMLYDAKTRKPREQSAKIVVMLMRLGSEALLDLSKEDHPWLRKKVLEAIETISFLEVRTTTASASPSWEIHSAPDNEK